MSLKPFVVLLAIASLTSTGAAASSDVVVGAEPPAGSGAPHTRGGPGDCIVVDPWRPHVSVDPLQCIPEP